MTQNNLNQEQKNDEKKETDKEKDTSKSISNDLTTDEKNRLKILKLKDDPSFKNVIKNIKDPAEKKELEDKYKAIYGNEFGNLEISPEEKNELKNLNDRNSQDYIKKITVLKHELLKAPSENNFKNFPKEIEPQAQNDPAIPNLEYVRLLMSQLPPELQAIFSEYFVLELNTSNWSNPSSKSGNKRNEMLSISSGGAIVEKFTDINSNSKEKFKIIIDKDSLYDFHESELGGIKFSAKTLNTNKLTYLVTRAILSTIDSDQKQDFVEYCKKNKIKKGLDKNVNNFEDWLAICLSNNDQAKKIDKELTEKAQKWLGSIYKNQNLIDTKNFKTTTINKTEFNEHLINDRLSKWEDSETGQEIKGPQAWMLNLFRNMNLSGVGKWLYSVSSVINLSKILSKGEYYYYMIAESDGKQVQKLLSRDLGTGDYIKLLKEPKYLNSKDDLRILILTIANKAAYQSWMLHLWLWKFDDVYRKSKGKEVSEDGFDLTNRVAKAYGKAARGPAAVTEYVQKGSKYIRFSYAQQLGKLDAILNTFSLRDIQRIAPDVFQNLYNGKDKKLIDIDQKLGDKGYYVSGDVNLDSLIGEGGRFGAKNFVNDMKDYSQELGEEEFLNLANAGVKAIVRRYLQESRTEPVLFSMYTPPMVKHGFETYKNKVGEPAYSEEKYIEDFKNEKKSLAEYNFSVDKKANNSSYDELFDIYSNLVKEKREFPYVKGLIASKHGRLIEYINQSKEKIRELPKSISEDLKSQLIAVINRYEKSPSISVEMTDKVKADLDKKLSSVSREASVIIRKTMDEFFTHLENYGIIKNYQKLFKPYEQNLNNLLSKGKDKKGDVNSKQEKLNYLYKELLPAEGINAQDKIKNLERMYPELALSSNERKNIEKLTSDTDKITFYANLISKKIESPIVGGKASFSKEYDKLNLLYFDVNQKVAHPDDVSGDEEELISRFRELELLPKEVRQSEINTLLDLQNALKLAKVVADDYEEQDKTKRQRREQYVIDIGNNPEMEEQLEYEEMQG